MAKYFPLKFSKRTQVLLKTAILIFGLVFPNAECCIRGGQLRRRIPKDEPPLVYKQHVPNVAEFSGHAAGPPEGRIFAKSPRFRDLVYNDNPDIIFKDEEMKLKWRNKKKVPFEDHYMSVRCKEKLDFLSILVRNTKWKYPVKLRVTEAWDQQLAHGRDSLHNEGRALDVTTSDRDRRKLGLLAQLAVQAGFDYVYYATQAHVHVACKSDRIVGQKRAFRCFDENSTVLLNDGTLKRMSQLKIGDSVQSISANGNINFSPILMFMDRLPGVDGDFMEIGTKSSDSDSTTTRQPLTISRYHLIYRIKPDFLNPNHSETEKLFLQNQLSRWREMTEAIFAKDLQIGDRVVHTSAGSGVGVRYVISRRLVRRTGAYAPLTADGTIVVNDVLASCYAATRFERLAHAVFLPVRAWNRLRDVFGWSLGGSREPQLEVGGIHWYPNFLMKIARFLQRWLAIDILLS